MRWSYKTVHFELKKDGLLGGAFLDDAEIEETLNDYGQSGWELVSMFETRDGVIAVFKQPLDLGSTRRMMTRQENTVKDVPRSEMSYRSRPQELEDESDEILHHRETEASLPVIDSHGKKQQRKQKEDARDESDNGIGSIRIE